MADLFERGGQRGARPRYERRPIVNACCYALRTGCAWRLLPKNFPPWQATYMSFKRWAAAGVFAAMHDRLRQQWRQRMGKAQDAQQPLRPQVVPKGFVVQAKRWVVKRTHAWDEFARRLMAHHDRSNWASLAWVWLAEARILASRMTT